MEEPAAEPIKSDNVTAPNAAAIKIAQPLWRWIAAYVAAAIVWLAAGFLLMAIMVTYQQKYSAVYAALSWATVLSMRIFLQPWSYVAMAAGLALLALAAWWGRKLEKRSGWPLHGIYLAYCLIAICSIVMLAVISVWVPWQRYAEAH